MRRCGRKARAGSAGGAVARLQLILYTLRGYVGTWVRGYVGTGWYFMHIMHNMHTRVHSIILEYYECESYMTYTYYSS